MVIVQSAAPVWHGFANRLSKAERCTTSRQCNPGALCTVTFLYSNVVSQSRSSPANKTPSLLCCFILFILSSRLHLQPYSVVVASRFLLAKTAYAGSFKTL